MHRRRRCFPLITSSICIALITTHIITGIINTNKLLYAASPMMTFTLSKYYTLITSAFLHTTLQHLIGNLLFLIAIGSTLEHKYGSIIFLYYSLLLVPLTALATALTYSLLQIFDMQYYSTGVIGYSGVIFGYLAIYAWGGRYSQWNICGYNILLYVPIIFLIYQTIILIYQLKYSQTSITSTIYIYIYISSYLGTNHWIFDIQRCFHWVCLL